MARPTRTQVNELEKRRLEVSGGAPQSYFRPARPPRGVEGGVDFSALSQSLGGLIRTAKQEEGKVDQEEVEKGRIEAEANRSKSIKDWAKVNPDHSPHRQIGNYEMMGEHLISLYQRQLSERLDDAVALHRELDENGIPKRKATVEELQQQAWDAVTKSFTDAGREDLLDNFWVRKSFSAGRGAVERKFMLDADAGFDVNLKAHVTNQASAQVGKRLSAYHHFSMENNGGQEYDPKSKKDLEGLAARLHRQGVPDVPGVMHGALVTAVNEIALEHGVEEASAFLDYFATAKVNGIPLNRHRKIGVQLTGKQRALVDEADNEEHDENKRRKDESQAAVGEWYETKGEDYAKARVKGQQASLNYLENARKEVLSDPSLAGHQKNALLDLFDQEMREARRDQSSPDSARQQYETAMQSGKWPDARKAALSMPADQQGAAFERVNREQALAPNTVSSPIYLDFKARYTAIADRVIKDSALLNSKTHSDVRRLARDEQARLKAEYFERVTTKKAAGQSRSQIDNEMSAWVEAKIRELDGAAQVLRDKHITKATASLNQFREQALTGNLKEEDAEFKVLSEDVQGKLRSNNVNALRDRTDVLQRHRNAARSAINAALNSSPAAELMAMRDDPTRESDLVRVTQDWHAKLEHEFDKWLDKDTTKKLRPTQFRKAATKFARDLTKRYGSEIWGPTGKARQAAIERDEADDTREARKELRRSATIRLDIQSALDGSFDAVSAPAYMLEKSKTLLHAKMETMDWLIDEGELRARTGERSVYGDPLRARVTSPREHLTQMLQARTGEEKAEHRRTALKMMQHGLDAIDSNRFNADFLKDPKERDRILSKTYQATRRLSGESWQNVVGGYAHAKINGEWKLLTLLPEKIDPSLTPLFLNDKGQPNYRSLDKWVDWVADTDEGHKAAGMLMKKLNWPFDDAAPDISKDEGFKSFVQAQSFALKNVIGGRK